MNMEMCSNYCPMISHFHKRGKRRDSCIILMSGKQFVIQYADICHILSDVINVFS